MQTLTVKLPDALAEEIDREAKTRRITKSEVVRERLAKKSEGKVSLWDRMKDLVIDDPNSPTDLSTNKKHMEGYGKSRPRR
jgi:Arc/MetJ-type ribon-helix-helix transcriptional regulator